MTYELNTRECAQCGAKVGEPCRFKSGKRLMRIHNPNPVAPKTDTPARPEVFTMYDHTGAVSVMDADEVRPYIDYLESTLAAERQEKVRIAENLANAEDAFTEVSDTLAAERASRLQADMEQFNAGIERAAQYVATMAAYPYANPLTDDTKSILGLMPNGIRNCAKPSVSPEQAEEKR